MRECARHRLVRSGLNPGQIRTLTFVMLLFAGQAKSMCCASKAVLDGSVISFSAR